MLEVWLYSIFSVIIISLIAFIGIFTIFLRMEQLRKTLLYMVSLSVGALFGGAFIHLLPEAAEAGFTIEVSLYVLSGIVVFFITEKLIHWRHCHVPTCEEHPHPFAYMNLVGDGVHNFIDGLIIAASYLAGLPVGIATTIAVILHEIPQEIGDFGVLIHGGFSRKKALCMNFLTALVALAGVVIALIVGGFVEGLSTFLLPFAAGGFIYIAGSDLIPELHKRTCESKSYLQLAAIVIGMFLMYLLVFLE
ncbi:MAG: ZIP family metal transporter [Candidatus Aenigmarchaeota archaeon]|nr:ZIP family metal transporter [Candidatus Aenigmarchaeota archaeon]